jgi:hypothetical protein
MRIGRRASDNLGTHMGIAERKKPRATGRGLPRHSTFRAGVPEQTRSSIDKNAKLFRVICPARCTLLHVQLHLVD